jgi:hypothetical protein
MLPSRMHYCIRLRDAFVRVGMSLCWTCLMKGRSQRLSPCQEARQLRAFVVCSGNLRERRTAWWAREAYENSFCSRCCRVPLHRNVPLNPKAYFQDCPTKNSLRVQWVAEHPGTWDGTLPTGSTIPPDESEARGDFFASAPFDGCSIKTRINIR